MLFVVLVTIPLVAMLLVLVLYGIMAVVGFLLLILIGVFFVLGWMIPGRPRQMGVRWFEEVLGALIQSVIITAVLGSVMVLDAILNAKIPTYGFFMVGMLNLATFVVGFRMRGRLENITGLGAGGSASPFSGYMAMRALGGIGKGAFKMTRGTIKGGVTATPILAGAAMGMGRAGGQLRRRGCPRRRPAPTGSLRNLPNNLLRMHPPAPGGGGVATPYRPPGSATAATGPGRKVITASPRTGTSGSGGGEPLGLPPGPQTVRRPRAGSGTGPHRSRAGPGRHPPVRRTRRVDPTAGVHPQHHRPARRRERPDGTKPRHLRTRSGAAHRRSAGGAAAARRPRLPALAPHPAGQPTHRRAVQRDQD